MFNTVYTHLNVDTVNVLVRKHLIMEGVSTVRDLKQSLQDRRVEVLWFLVNLTKY